MVKVSNIIQKPRFSLDNVNGRQITKRFGKPEDNIELFITDKRGNIVFTDHNFTDYTQGEYDSNDSTLFSEFNINPVSILKKHRFTTGEYVLFFNVHRKKLSGFDEIFKITEISPSRREIRTTAQNITERRLEMLINDLINNMETSAFFKDLVLNFNSNKLATVINIKINKLGKSLEILFKLFEPLAPGISKNSEARLVEELTDPLEIKVDLGIPEEIDTSEELQGPNFKIDVRLNNSVPSYFKNYDEILNYNLTSSYEDLLNQLEGGEIPNIQYDLIRTISSSTEDFDTPYHFENFVHFGSAEERLRNFNYKLKLIELYDSQLGEVNTIGGGTATEEVVIIAKDDIYKKKQKLIKGFDGYERFLYYTSGSWATWPKRNESYPYTLYSITSSQALTWLGESDSSVPTYGGQLQSASFYDKQNEYSLINLIPKHITNNPDNSFYTTFVNMVGHHFDGIWTYINELSNTNDSHPTRGISKDLVYLQLQSLGIDTFDQFENSNLIEYILGHGTGSSNFYDAPLNQTLVTASNDGSIPKGDITKEIWKRLYHNAPYLLKTKGTERGLKALMSCYGIPSTILNVKEYAGSTTTAGQPTRNTDLVDTYKTFTYEKSGLALHGDSGTTEGYFIKTNWSSSAGYAAPYASHSAKTVEFRIKPKHPGELSSEIYHLFTLTGSVQGTTRDEHILLQPYTGTDISSSGDYKQYGRLIHLKTGSNTFPTTDDIFATTTATATQYFPIFNGDFWNIFARVDVGALTNSDTVAIEFGASQANFNKNITFISTSSKQYGMDRVAGTWGLQNTTHTLGYLPTYLAGAKRAILGGLPNSVYRYSGSLQEIRYYFNEYLTDKTLKKHALEPFMYSGNSVSSSYDNLILRLPLGSNDKQDSSSFHPNDSQYILNMENGVSSSMSSQKWEEVIEPHYHLTPDTVGISTTSEKVRIDEGEIDSNILSTFIKSETSTLDRQPPDFEDLGVFFSPTTEINEDIMYTLGSFRLDDYIGSPLPSAQTASKYDDLNALKDIYFKKVKTKYNYWDYVKIIQYIDHTLFKVIEQFVPAKANLKTGLLIEPHYLERTKFARELPMRSDGQTMTPSLHQEINFQIDPEKQFTIQSSSVVATNDFANLYKHQTGSDGMRLEQGTMVTIDIDDYVLDEESNISQAPTTPYTGTEPEFYVKHHSSVLLGNAVRGRASSNYYRKNIVNEGGAASPEY